jgi:hypothetical protein
MGAVIEDDFDVNDLIQEKQFRMCFPKTDDTSQLLAGFIYFCTHFWHIRHPSQGRIRFDLFEAQLETVDSWLNNRYSLILKARQVGFSTLVAAYAFWLAQYPDRSILMLSRTEREAIKLLQKSKYGAQFLPEWMKWRLGPMNATQTKMEFSNNSYIESLPSASDPARGESAYLIVVDELAFLNNSEEAWSAIEPVADVGGRVIMFSTANGEGNLFHELWVGATTGANRFVPLFFPWSANGRDEEWYEAKARDLPEWQMAQEYPDNPEDAFLKSGRPVFDLKMLRDIETKPPLASGYIDESGHLQEDGGALKIWRMPDPNGRYVIGADASQGLEHGDYAAAHVINARDHEVVAVWHGHTDPDLFGTDVLARLGKFYNQALIGVENNAHGLTTLKYLQQKKYFPIYYERSPKYKQSVPTDVLGFRTTQSSKPLIIDSLAEALRHSMKIYDEHTIAELRTFVRDDKGKMGGSPFDDRTMSLAIANHMLKFVWHAQYQPEKEIIPGSFADWERRTYGTTFDDLIQQTLRKSHAPPRKPIGTYAVRTRI